MADGEEEFFSYLPDDFKEYMYKELNWLPLKHRSGLYHGEVFWSREDDEPQSPSTLPDGDISNLNKIIRDLLYGQIFPSMRFPTLVQFWAPITTKEGRLVLTTRNQPFSLSLFYGRIHVEVLSGYRMISMNYEFDIEQHIGLPGRVFKHQFPESTPNVEYYSITEYPQLHEASRCGVFGVKQSLAFPVFESSNQRCVGVIEVVASTKKECLIKQAYSLYQIHGGFKEKGLKCVIGFDRRHVELDHKIALAEIKNVLEIVCDDHDLPFAQAWVPCKVGCPCTALVDGGILGVSCQYREDRCRFEFSEASSLFHLKKGQGVVGRALLSTNMVFCRDVTQLSLTEYPLAHYARKDGLRGCFAICLQSSCTENDDYVLEFFLPVSNETNENPHALLKKILETMRKKFRTLRVASGKELGEELHIEEIGIQNGQELDRVQMPQTTISLPRSESAPRVDLEQRSQLNLDDLPSTQPSATIVHTEPHDITMQDANVVTIKAKFAEGRAIRFRLSLSSGLIELQQEVAQRLNLEAGTYSVEYKDEDGDLILIGCDEDLRDYMCVSRLEGKTCIVVLLQPITDHL